MPLIWEQAGSSGTGIFAFLFSLFSVRGSGGPEPAIVSALLEFGSRRLGEQPHAGPHSAGPFSSSFGSFTQPCTQWLHKADYKLQRIPEGAKSDAGANEPREPLIPVTEWDKLGKAWTTQIQAHQAAESLPWEPGVITRPIQRGPGNLGVGRLAREGAAARAWGSGAPRGRWPGEDAGRPLVRWHRRRSQLSPRSDRPKLAPGGAQEATRGMDSPQPLFTQRPDRTARSLRQPWAAAPCWCPTPPALQGPLCAQSPPNPAHLSHRSSWQPVSGGRP